ncbi:transglutaminase family protein [Croceibacterium sp. TMG7-5b_MA50]|uniref:transglutaminase family protein n=1 Tax=Croceibacterium sp. TMG7-5b_MA50 TaxID=3121290 RepID=UPI00322195B9
MRYSVRQDTRLFYRGSISDARLNLRLKPVGWPGQTISGFSMTIDPQPAWRADAPGPYLTHVTAVRYDQPVETLRIVTEFTADIHPPPVPSATPAIGRIPELAATTRRLDPLAPAPYLYGGPMTPLDETIGSWAAADLSPEMPVLDGARALAARIHREFAYSSGSTTARTLPAEAFAQRKGVCQDFAHVLIVAMRMHGVPAAYVSGYLRTLPPPGRPRLVGADAMHAWAAVWCGPDAGWIGIDPTNNSLARDDHIFLGMGRDYADVAPVNGIFVGRARQQTDFRVDVVPAGEPAAHPLSRRSG